MPTEIQLPDGRKEVCEDHVALARERRGEVAIVGGYIWSTRANPVDLPELPAGADIVPEFFDEMERTYPAGKLSVESTIGTSRALYALVRHTKPSRVVEVGSHVGATTVWLARAVKENGSGRVVAYEVVESVANACRANLRRAGVADVAEVIVKDLLVSPEKVWTDFAFIDHEPKSTYRAMFNRLDVAPGAMVCAHDLDLSPEASEDPRRLWDNLRSSPEWDALHFPQERGLMVARRVK